MSPAAVVPSTDAEAVSDITGESAVDPKLRKAAQGFEAIFMREMLKTALPDGFGGAEAYRSWTTEALGDSMAQSGGIGLADWIVRQQSKKG